MIYLFVGLHAIVCVFLILVVLLQQGKSADWAGTFGGGSSQAAFGARGTATILSKATTAAAVIFMLTSLILTILVARPGGKSVLPTDAGKAPAASQPAPTPSTPAAPAATGDQQKAPETPAPAAPTTEQPKEQPK
jgi:preprotein translocase subunit SecG